MAAPRTPPPPSCGTLRGVFRCSLFLGMVGFVAAAIGAHALWRKTDKLVESALLAQIEERVPDWDLTFRSAKADWSGQVRVRDVVLNGFDGRPFVEIPEMILELDMNLLLGSQKVLVKCVRINDPVVRVRCYDSLRWREKEVWNFHLPKPNPSETAPPDVIVENGALLVQMAPTEGNSVAEFRAAGIRVNATPDSRHGYSTEIDAQVQHVGRIEVTARTDFDHGALEVKGRCDQIDLAGVVQTILGVSPQARDQVATLSALSEKTRRSRSVQLASAGAAEPVLEPAAPTGNALDDLGLHADLNIGFDVSRARRDSPLAYSVIAEVRDGQVTNPNIPAPLYGLKGHIAVNQDGLVIRNLAASNGDRRLNIDGHWEFRGANPERRFTVQATELSIGPEVRSYLPPPLQAKYDQLRPEGKFKVDVEYNSAFEGIPIKLRELSVVDGVVQHELFPYRVTGITGGVRQEGASFALDFQGLANGRRIDLKGSLAALSADAALSLRVFAPQLPFDDELLRAFAESKQPALNKLHPVLVSLNASGLADWEVHLDKAGGQGQKFLLTKLKGAVSRGAISYEKFPYYISDVTGLIEFERARGNVWRFRNLRGIHAADPGVTQITGEGSFALDPAPGRLELTFNGLNVPLDLDLHTASVRALPNLERAWEELAPSGSADVTGLTIGWSPQQPVQLLLPSVQLKDVRIKPKHLPYAWGQLNGAVQWNGRRVIIRSLQAYHDQAYLNIDSGGSEDFAYFEIAPGATTTWRLHLQDLMIRKLIVDDELRSALPGSIRTIVQHASPTDPLDLKLGIDLKGSTASEVVTAAWTTEAVINGGSLTLGVPMQNVQGVIGITSGTFNGETVSAVGSANFQKATILSLPFTDLKTPFRVEGSRLSVGSPSWDQLATSGVKSPYSGRPLRAALYGGEVALDATATIDAMNRENSTYALQLNVENVQLQSVARANQWRERLYGSIGGFVSLRGAGSDLSKIVTDDRTKNWVQIQPAKLLDLPVLMKIFQLVSFTPNDNFMFNSAYGEFKIRNGLFDFSTITLDGSNMSLIGSGTVGFPPTAPLDLQFFTRAQSNVPIIAPFVKALGRNWVAVTVRGTSDQPVVQQQTQLPIVSDAFRELMNAVDRGQALGRPGGR